VQWLVSLKVLVCSRTIEKKTDMARKAEPWDNATFASAIDIVSRNIRSDTFQLLNRGEGSLRINDGTMGHVLNDKDTPALSFYSQSLFLVRIRRMNPSLKCSVVGIIERPNTTVRWFLIYQLLNVVGECRKNCPKVPSLWSRSDIIRKWP
jgi:hypothetical protein